MQRRDFIKISAITGATAALDSCGQPDVQLIRFIPEEDLTPGVATWKPSICTLCPAGCGTLVKVMPGEAEVIRNGRLGLIRMGLAKKIEGNPNHPINQGKLCPRGQAMLQVTYHPDRIKHPLKRTGPRGSGQFQEISWDEAIGELVAKLGPLQRSVDRDSIVFLSKPIPGILRTVLAMFARVIDFEFFDRDVLRLANNMCFGIPRMPTFDLADANYVMSFGADFLGTWNSPVSQAIGFGRMRQGRPGLRGKFVQIEPRISYTGASADEWIAIPPGTEGFLALGIAHVILRDRLYPASSSPDVVKLIEGWSKGLPDYDPTRTEKATGIAARTVTRLATEMATHPPSAAMMGGAAVAHTNGLFNALAVNALNVLLGNTSDNGAVRIAYTGHARISYWASTVTPGFRAISQLAHDLAANSPDAPKAVLLYDANPVFAMPPALQVREALEKAPFIASFGSFIDETSVLSDLILPDHSPLESWISYFLESGFEGFIENIAAPALRPLHDTRSMPDVLAEVAQKIGAGAYLMPSFEKEIYNRYFGDPVRAWASPEDAPKVWREMLEKGGTWNESAGVPFRFPKPMPPVKFEEPKFDGDLPAYPFCFLPYASQALYDGSLAHLPWLQEMPDPLSTAMWNSWVEINTKTAERLGIKQGDEVEVESQHGKLQAPALVTPGIAPDVIAMPVGQGHTNFTRYASGQGANPISILAPMVVPETGSLAWAATRVKISKVGKGKLALFAGGMREHPHEHR